jgi:hypothetical protein
MVREAAAEFCEKYIGIRSTTGTPPFNNALHPFAGRFIHQVVPQGPVKPNPLVAEKCGEGSSSSFAQSEYLVYREDQVMTSDDL